MPLKFDFYVNHRFFTKLVMTKFISDLLPNIRLDICLERSLIGHHDHLISEASTYNFLKYQ